MSSASLDGRSLKRIAIAGANYVNQKRLELNNINVFPVPDGDTGTNLALTLLAAAQAADELKEKPPIGEVARTLARASLFGAKGNSGFILSQLFCGLADELEGKRKANVPELAGAFNSGVLRAYQAVSNPREGTVLTVMRETFDYGAQIAEKTTDIREWLGTILLRSRQVLSLTPELLPVLKQQGVVDSG
ncbi:MAG: DAK2 domain-containing protein, partial [Bacteroidota bacterium]